VIGICHIANATHAFRNVLPAAAKKSYPVPLHCTAKDKPDS